MAAPSDLTPELAQMRALGYRVGHAMPDVVFIEGPGFASYAAAGDRSLHAAIRATHAERKRQDDENRRPQGGPGGGGR